MSHYVEIAARNRNWQVDIINDKRPFLIKYTKGDLFFYSTIFVSIDVNHQPQQLSSNKALTYFVLKQEGINILPFEVIKKVDSQILYQRYSCNDTNPVVIKPLDSYGGRGVIKCDNYLAYCIAMEKIADCEYGISPFFDHFIEIRFLVFNNKVELIHPKYENQTNKIRPKHPSQLHIGLGKLKNMKKQALKIAKALKYDFLAVDFLVSDEDFIVIETNLTPSLLKYSDKSERNKHKAIRLYEKIFDYKEELLSFKKGNH